MGLYVARVCQFVRFSRYARKRKMAKAGLLARARFMYERRDIDDVYFQRVYRADYLLRFVFHSPALAL